METPDSEGEASSKETTPSVSQENQSQHQHQHQHQHQPDNVNSLDANSDVRLWLQYTGFFDTEQRLKVLDGFRRLKHLDEQRLKLLEEIRTSTEYSSSSTIATTPQMFFAFKDPSPTFSMAMARFNDDNVLSGSQSTAFASSNRNCGSEISSFNKGVDSDTWSTAFRNGLPSRQRSTQNAKSLIKATTSLGEPESRIQGAQSLSSSDGPFEAEMTCFSKSQSMRAYTPSHLLSLAPKQAVAESRYFLVKSFNFKNVDMSQRDGLWITSARNGAIFANAFKHHKNVYLIFSVNKSKAFQGYARMTSPPTTTIPPPEWMNNISWEASLPFRVQWLSTHRTEFWKFGKLRNPLNDWKPIFVGRDGQEFPETCGREMVYVLDRGTAVREGGRSGADSWRARKDYDGADKDEAITWHHDETGKNEMTTWHHPDADKKELTTWRHHETNKDETTTWQHHCEWSETEEDIPASEESETTDDMPLIKY
ncbi:YTH domain-containing protein [Trichoderma simmonsii]|uniref:YTH domain-containing protein n=1 Tax=Trichoderma simmonsii TaxID=1491479 RepID=A0A8G0LI95_9HYPO|nr:YTH domain-containing protein [Trichoderma simmonsii]